MIVANDVAGPTPEQMERACFVLDDVLDKQSNGRTMTIGKAYRRVPVIDTLRADGLFTYDQHKALAHYRHFANVADHSPLRDSLCVERYGGSGGVPSHDLLVANRVVTQCEAAAGSLVDILRAVVVDDLSLSEWAMRKTGAVEVRRARGCSLEPTKGALATARLEIQIAATRVQAELDA